MHSKHASTFLPCLASWAEAAEGSQLNDLTIVQFKDVGACMMALPEKLSCEPVHRLVTQNCLVAHGTATRLHEK